MTSIAYKPHVVRRISSGKRPQSVKALPGPDNCPTNAASLQELPGEIPSEGAVLTGQGDFYQEETTPMGA
eukprot:10251373-Karenia_brevis.AAC.1